MLVHYAVNANSFSVYLPLQYGYIQMKEIYHLTGCTRGKKLLQQSVAKSNCSAT